MEKLKFTTFSLLLVITWGCANNDRHSGIEEIQLKQNEQETFTSSSDKYLESMQNVDSQISSLTAKIETKREQINFLSAKKDSILKASEQIRISTEQVKLKKIDPGIEGVNLKLNELKGQKENLQEQQNLQKMEVVLAEKKIELQKEEKEVYNAQRKALWDKGAPPDDFTTVDSLLTGIDRYLIEQTSRLKSLNRSIADIDEQITAIDQQRNSLSSKIRNNYTAQKIFEEYSVEERDRLEKQLANVEEQLKQLLIEQDDLNSELAISTGDKNYLHIKQDEQKALKLSEEARLDEISFQNDQLNAKKTSRNKNILYAFFAICLVALVIYILYVIGRKKNSQKL